MPYNTFWFYFTEGQAFKDLVVANQLFVAYCTPSFKIFSNRKIPGLQRTLNHLCNVLLPTLSSPISRDRVARLSKSTGRFLCLFALPTLEGCHVTFEDGNIFVGSSKYLTGATRTYRVQKLCHHFETEVMVTDHFRRHFLD